MTEEQYIRFLKYVYLKDNGEHLSSASISKYSRQTTRKIDSYLTRIIPDCSFSSIYDVDSIEELKRIQRLLNNNKEFKKENEIGNNMYSAGLNRYIEFAEGTLIAQFSNDTSILDIKEPVPKGVKVGTRYIPARDSVKIAQAKGACNYCCQIDPDHKSFTSAHTHKNYVEGHHIIPMNHQDSFNYSLDVLANIIVLCPNCHRLLHYAIKPERVDKLYRIYDERQERFSNAGILTDRKSFVEMAIG